MALRFSPLVSALTVSAALHVGAFATLDHALGGAMAGSAEVVPTRGAAPTMFVALSGTTAKVSQHSVAKPSQVPASSVAPGLIDLPMPQYFSAVDLDRKPEAIGEVPLAYPPAMPLVKHGRVVLSLLIDEQGSVDKVIVESADSPRELEELASRAFSSIQFTPGIRGGATVKSRLRVEVTFEGE